MKIKSLAAVMTVVFGLNAGALAATEGVDYTLAQPPVEQLQQDKVEVLEFLSYKCPHCRNLDPIILKHSKTFAADTYFRTEHVVWDPRNDLGLARLLAVVNEMGIKHQANPLIFNAIFSNINLGNPEILQEWALTQTAFDGKKLAENLNGFNAQTKAKQMADWTAKYNITGTPTVIVGGKYKVEFHQGFEAGMKTVDELIQKVREERGMKTPSKVAIIPVRSKGASLVKQANH